MLTQTADHALRALLAIARQGGDRPLRLEDIAVLTGAPRNYLGKTLSALVKAGLLRSARGPLGGFTLAVPAAEITVARISDLFAEPRSARRCLMADAPCNPSHPCTAHERWSALTAEARSPLHRSTIADLLFGRDNTPAATPARAADAIAGIAGPT